MYLARTIMQVTLHLHLYTPGYPLSICINCKKPKGLDCSKLTPKQVNQVHYKILEKPTMALEDELVKHERDEPPGKCKYIPQ